MKKLNKIGLDQTCGNCKNLKFNSSIGLVIAGCGACHDYVVPHEAHLKNNKRGDNTILTFTRIPSFCPRSDKEVFKSEKPADHSITLEFNSKTNEIIKGALNEKI